VASLGRPAPVAAPEGLSGPRRCARALRALVQLARMRDSWNEVFGHVAMVFCAPGLGVPGVRLVRALLRGTARNGGAHRRTAGPLERKLYELPTLREAMREGLISYERALIARHADSGRSQSGSRAAEGLTCVELREALQDQEEAQMCARTSTRAWVPPSVAGLLLLTIAAVRRRMEAAFAGGMLREGLRSLHRGVEAHPSGGKENAVETGAEARSRAMPGAGLQQGRSAFASHAVSARGRRRGGELDRAFARHTTCAGATWGACGCGTNRRGRSGGIGGGRRGSAAAGVSSAGAGAGAG